MALNLSTLRILSSCLPGSMSALHPAHAISTESGVCVSGHIRNFFGLGCLSKGFYFFSVPDVYGVKAAIESRPAVHGKEPNAFSLITQEVTS